MGDTVRAACALRYLFAVDFALWLQIRGTWR